MENQSHIQQKYNNLIYKIKENLNYIYIVLMIIINILLSILTIEDGNIGLRYPHSLLGWILWALQIIIQTVIGVLILNAFRRQGIKIGHSAIKDTYDKYLKVTQKDTKKGPRSLKEYLGKEALKDSIFKSGILIILSIFVGSVIIGANLNNILSLVINIICAVCFGIKAMLDAEDFVITELVAWYQLKIAEVTDQEKEPAKENKNVKLSRNMQGCKKSTRTSRVQQKKKCGTRPKTCNNKQSDTTDIESST